MFVDSTQWTPAFRQHLENTGLGDSVWGYSITDGAGQLTPLPFANADRVRVRFGREAQVAADDLVVRGMTRPLYPQATLPDGSEAQQFQAGSFRLTETWLDQQ